MTTYEIFMDFYPKLIEMLPMNDCTFTAKLYSQKLLPGNLKEKVKSLPTSADKAEHFLDTMIMQPSAEIINDDSFEKLLRIMEDSKFNSLNNLAQQINVRLGKIFSSSATNTGKCMHACTTCMNTYTDVYFMNKR